MLGRFSLLIPYLLISQILAQDSCFQLKDTTTCPGMEDAMVKQTSSYNDVKSFDAFLTDNYFPSSTNYLSSFQTYYDCPNYQGQNIRFHISTICSYLIQKSGCVQPSKITPLCSESCLLMSSSTEDLVFKNSSACNQTPSSEVAGRRTDPTMYSEFCKGLKSSKDDSKCSAGVTSEVDQCGFINVADANAACLSNLKGDACCSSMKLAQTKAAAKGLDPPNNTAVIVGVSIAGIVLILLIFFFYVKGKQWNKMSTKAIPLTKQEKTKSIFGNIATGARMSFSSQSKQVSSSSSNKVVDYKYNNYSMAPPVPAINNKFLTPSTPVENLPQQSAAKSNIKMQVIDSYESTLSDEISLKIKDIILVEQTWDDGWAMGKNLNTGLSGAFPLACTVPIDVEAFGVSRESRVGGGYSGRTSSLYSAYPLK